ncbi:MAG: class I SAM-dependent methyltransferase [Vicinamibacterales bacterium]
MTTTAQRPIQPHNERPAAVWSAGGADYDAISRGIADSSEHCVLRLDPRPGERILDVATGTGWTSRLVARRGATVTGVDIAAELVASARSRAAIEGLPIEYHVGDAEALPFGDGEFDAVVSTVGVMFASRPEAVAAELARVVRPGGRLALTTWTDDSSVHRMFQVMKAYMPPPPASPPPSPFEWGKQARLRELLASAFELGFEHGVSYYREPDAAAAWETFVTGYGPTRMLAASLPPDRREALKQDFVAFHDAYATDLGVTVPRTYWLTLGRKR